MITAVRVLHGCSWGTKRLNSLESNQTHAPMRKRGGSGQEGATPDGVDVKNELAGSVSIPEAVASAPELRPPRHGGWKGTEPGREAAMLRGEPGYHLGLFRICYGVLLVQRTLAFMSSGAVDASFASSGPSSPGGQTATGVLNFGHGFLLLGSLGSPSADAVRSACWCICAAGVAISVGFRPNAVAFTASVMQLSLLLLEKSLYTDEAYLFVLVALLLSCTDCGKTLGLDAPKVEEGSVPGGGGGSGWAAALRDQPADTVPHWHVVLIRFQVCLLYVHRGLAKATTTDWLLAGQPLLHTLESMPPTHVIRRAVGWAIDNGVPGSGGGGLQALAVRANGSMVFLDLFLGVSLLAAAHYRPAALSIQTAIHLCCAVFGPTEARAWHLLIVATGVLFLDPSSLKTNLGRVQAWLQPAVSYDTRGRSARGNRGSRGRRPLRGSDRTNGFQAGGAGAIGGNARGGLGEPTTGMVQNTTRAKKKLPLQPKPSAVTAALVSLYILTQVFLPLRHFLAAFPVEWSREGHEFSWRAGGDGGGRGGGGGLVREEGLVRVLHSPRAEGRVGRGLTTGVQTVHLYGAPFTAQQVFRLVLDPDMLLQLTKKTAETSPAAGGGRGERGGQGGRGGGHAKQLRTPPRSNVDAWKSINGRPFSRWIDPSVDVWDDLFEGEGPSNLEWLHAPIADAELERAAGMMEAVRTKWAIRDLGVTFFAARAGQAGLSNVYLGGYDPSNFNTTELCSVPLPPSPGAGHDSHTTGRVAETAEGGGILLGVAMGEVDLLTDAGNGAAEPKTQVLKVGSGTVLAPIRQGHSVRVAAPKAKGRGMEGTLAVWYYVHSCPDGLFHLCIGFLSGAGWEQLYAPHMGTRKGWLREHGVPRS